MKLTQLTYSIFAGLVLSAAAVQGQHLPPLNVVVSDSDGKLAYRGKTNTDGTFETRALAPGNYVVQLSSNHPAFSERTFALVASAGRKKTVAAAVPGEKFAGGGVAMRIPVTRRLNITGQVASSMAAISYRHGRGLVTTARGTQVGSNLRLADDSTASRYNINIWTPEEVYKFQERTNVGDGR